MKEKAIDFLKKNYILIICAVCVIISIAALITALVPSQNSVDESEPAVSSVEWGNGLTEGIPEFSPSAASLISADNSVAAYYENVSGEQINEYLQTLKSECGIELSGEGFPRSAKWGERLITVHYNATDMLFSVTVSAVE